MMRNDNRKNPKPSQEWDDEKKEQKHRQKKTHHKWKISQESIRKSEKLDRWLKHNRQDTQEL